MLGVFLQQRPGSRSAARRSLEGPRPMIAKRTRICSSVAMTAFSASIVMWASMSSQNSCFLSGSSQGGSWHYASSSATALLANHESYTGRRFLTSRQAAEIDESAEDDSEELENNPAWQEVQKQMGDIWDAQWELTSELTGTVQEWKTADDVRLLMDEQVRGVLGKYKFTELEEALAEVADEEPEPGYVAREDFIDIAGVFVYEQFYM
mmetsp:Transcript_7026/g.17017  ORF Transcript_7026/g.17017 Transcript_7026/m.17017 type:complete len:208 (-) Transcript_7026:242-865(-)